MAWQTTATAVWKITVWPLMRRNWAVARSWLPGLPRGWPPRSATWSEPITMASGRSAAGPGLGQRQAQRQGVR
jgi:hypothetical protein